MCTLAIYFRALREYPLLVAANRDEQYERPSAPPQLIGTRPKIVGGRDLRAGGTWLGMNEHGVAAAILNRRVGSTTRSIDNPRSRGLLCLDLLSQHSAAEAELFIRDHPGRYNPFTAIVADPNAVFAAYNPGARILTEKLSPGLHVFSSAAEFDLRSAKAERAYELFGHIGEKLNRAGAPEVNAVAALRAALADHSLPPASDDPGDAICVHRDSSGTVSSSIIACSPSFSRCAMFHCAGTPCQNDFDLAMHLEIR